MSLFEELKRRNVIRVAIAYAVVSWLIVQVADVVIDNIGAPPWFFQAILLLLAIGFPLAMIFAWAFELTPDGLRKEGDVDRETSVAPQTGHKLDRAIIGLLVVALGYFIWEARFAGDDPSGLPQEKTLADAAPASAQDELDRSIAVLPFTTRSTVDDDRFFSDGIHDDLLTQLAKIGSLKVISRTSVMEYRDTLKNLRQIGTELGVATVLEGAFQRSGNQVRINVQLIDATTDQHLWAENYDRELTASNLFAIQTDIAKSIACALHATLSPEEQERVEDNTLTDNLEALQAYQRGRLLSEDIFNGDSLERATQEAQRAVQLDPGFGAAWALLASTQMSRYWRIKSDRELIAGARLAIDRGRAIAPNLAELDIAEGHYYYWGFLDYDNATRVLEPVLEAYPNNAEVRKVLGFVYRRQGRFDESLEQVARSLALDPRSLEAAATLVETHQLLRDREKAVEALDRLAAIDPSSRLFYAVAGWQAYSMDGDAETASRYLSYVEESWLYELWLASLALGRADPLQDFSGFDDYRGLGKVLFLPSLIQGLTSKFTGDAAAAAPLLDEAINTYREQLEQSPGEFRILKPLCLAEGAAGMNEDAARHCRAALAELPDDAFERNYHRMDIAGGLAMAGFEDEALKLLERVMSDRAGPMPAELRLSPYFDSLHSDPRWQALVAIPGSL